MKNLNKSNLSKKELEDNPLKFDFIEELAKNFDFDPNKLFYKALPTHEYKKNDFGDINPVITNQIYNATFSDGYNIFPVLFKVAKWDGIRNAVKDLNSLNKSFKEGCFITKDNQDEWLVLMRKDLLFKLLKNNGKETD